MSKFSDSGACACDEKPASNLSNGSSNGEEQTLEAIEKFRKFYEDKLRQIDIDGRGDCTELKLKLQERWIKDLTEQTEMMARVVKELEEEATTRVRMLEDKLKQTSKAAYELKKETDGKKSEEMENLEQRLKDAEAKICRMRPCVDTRTACTAMDDLLEAKEKELEKEITRREREVEDLQNKIKDLENTLNNSQARSENLQKAVDLYLNSINVLEASEERSRIEIEQQRVTINNLQDALVTTKHELDELRQKNQQEVSFGWAARWFGTTSSPTPKPNNAKSVHDI